LSYALRLCQGPRFAIICADTKGNAWYYFLFLSKARKIITGKIELRYTDYIKKFQGAAKLWRVSQTSPRALDFSSLI
jgi:hypothetical protein